MKDAGAIEVTGDQKKEEVNRNFEFRNNLTNCRYIRFAVTGTKSLPIWHPSAGGDSCVRGMKLWLNNLQSLNNGPETQLPVFAFSIRWAYSLNRIFWLNLRNTTRLNNIKHEI